MCVHIAFDGLSGVDGSARFSFGTATAIASVSGPIAARLAAEHHIRATVDVHLRPLVSVPGTAEKRTATTLRGILARACILAHHPRTLIQVVVQVLSPSPSSSQVSPDADVDTDVLLAAEINACSLALLNAGSIPMRGVVCAVAVAQSPPTPDGPDLFQPQPRLVMQRSLSSDRTSRHLYSGCFAFIFGIDPSFSTDVSGAAVDIMPSKMIWTNYRACSGNAFSAIALAEAERVALGGATAVWKEMKESLRTSSFAGDGP